MVNRSLTRALFKAFADEVAQVAHASGVPLGDWSGDQGTHPEFNAEQVEFNGVGDDHLETFRITRRKPSSISDNFVKTNRNPYDVVVVATLCLLNDHFPGHYEITTDGDPSDWEKGYSLAVATVKRPLPFSDLFPDRPGRPAKNDEAAALEAQICDPLNEAQRRAKAALDVALPTVRRRPRHRG